MSYILDALKKSERQRPPGPVPDLFTVHGPQPATPRLPLRALAAVALLLLSSAAGLWAWLGTAGHEAETGPAQIDAVPAPRRATSPGPAASRAENSSPPPPAPTSTRPLAPIRPPAPVVRDAAPPVSPFARNARESSAQPTAPAAIPVVPQIAATQEHAAPHAGQEVAGLPDVSLPENGESAAALEEEQPGTPPGEKAPTDGRVLDLAELPASIRAELPQLTVSGYVWSEDPSLRLLTVNDRLQREGEEVAPGVRLQEITAKGAVFVFKGWRFRAGGVRP